MANSSAERFLADAQRRGLGIDDVVQDGPLAGKTVREIYAIKQQSEQGYNEVRQASGGAQMSIQEAIEMLMATPDPRSARVPYGPYAGRSLAELMQRAQETQSLYQELGIIDKPPEEPGMFEQFTPMLGQVGATILGMKASDEISGQSDVNAALAEAIRGGVPAAGAVAGAKALAAGVPTGYAATQAALTGTAPAVPSVVGGQAVASTVPSTAPSMFGPTMSAALPWLGVAGIGAAAAQQGYSAYKDFKAGNNEKGGLRSALLATGPVLGWAAPAVDFLGLGGGHEKHFYERAANRDAFREDTGIYQGNNIGLAGGNSFDIGSMDRSYDIDLDAVNADPNKAHQVAQLDALTTALGLTGDARSQQTGEFANAVWSKGNADANVQQIFKNSNRTFDEIRDGLRNDTTLDEAKRNSYLALVDEVERYSPNAAAQLPSPSTPQVDRNAGRPTPAAASQSMALARSLLPTASPGQAKPRTAKLKAFWGS